ncbi:MAG: hypothetical protein IJI96_00855 [Methanobrevibacter sp.]|nr:hypothetical protein [Methanobrevibacter sp.]MBQ6628872.1 hypothetical protein [Methanobrevibacter sp.]
MYDERVFYDADCLVCFLVVGQCEILQKLFSKMIIPAVVENEILGLRFNPKIQYNYNKLKKMGFVEVRAMVDGSKEHGRYLKLKKKYKFMGKGEAAVIALACEKGGIIASNNLLDVRGIVEDYGLNLITTSFILAKAYEEDVKTRAELDNIWKDMLREGRKRSLANARSFTEYYEGEYKTDSFYMKI